MHVKVWQTICYNLCYNVTYCLSHFCMHLWPIQFWYREHVTCTIDSLKIFSDSLWEKYKNSSRSNNNLLFGRLALQVFRSTMVSKTSCRNYFCKSSKNRLWNSSFVFSPGRKNSTGILFKESGLPEVTANFFPRFFKNFVSAHDWKMLHENEQKRRGKNIFWKS